MITATIVLVGGYVCSQWAFFNGEASEYAHRVDAPPIRALAAALLFGCLALAIIKPSEPEEARV